MQEFNPNNVGLDLMDDSTADASLCKFVHFYENNYGNTPMVENYFRNFLRKRKLLYLNAKEIPNFICFCIMLHFFYKLMKIGSLQLTIVISIFYFPFSTTCNKIQLN